MYVEGKTDRLVIKSVSMFGYHCKYCGKGFLNSTYVKKHEDNVCKKKSGYTQIGGGTDLKPSVENNFLPSVCNPTTSTWKTET